MREIGSEFWTQHKSICIENANHEAYLLSGRTALRFIIDDICESRLIRKVLLPSYCCESMIQPIVQSGMKVQFYQVQHNYIDYPFDNNADVVFLIDFFGYTMDKNCMIARREKQAGKIIIYDATHRIGGNPEVQRYSDYSFCSYRKWFYCNYAQATKHNGTFGDGKNLSINNRYIAIRDQAAHEKEAYLAGLIDEKKGFLSKFSAAEQMLDEDYIGYEGTPVSFDLHEIIAKRRENAAYLMDELQNISEFTLWRESLRPDDTPMFVPILVDALIRDDLRRKLVSENIYCPIHWPKSAYHDKPNELYDRELSLVCDQRYDIADMQRMVRVIKDYFNR